MTANFTGLLTELEQIGQQAAERDREAAQHRAAAERTHAEAEELAELATATATQGGNEVLRRLNTFMRELSQQVSDARQAAIDAISRGEGALDAWIKYRLTAARARGQWSSLSDDYQRLTGRAAPPGPSIPELRAETFDQLVRMVLPKAERAAYEQANLETIKAKEAHRAKVEAAKQARRPKAS